MPAKTKEKGAGTSKKATGLLIDGRVSEAQIERAVIALQKYREKGKHNREENELPLEGLEGLDGEGSRLDRGDVVWMQLTTKRLNPNAPIKAVRLPLPHAVWPKSSSVCLLTADPQRKYKDLMVEERLTQVKRVIGVTKLKGKFKPFEVRRQLMNEHEVFLADERIIAMLPKLLGKKWMDDRRSPIPVVLTKTKEGRLTKEVNSALASTYYYRNKGTCSSVRLGTLGHLTAAQIRENVAACLPRIIAKHVKGGWENIQSIDIKSGSSIALPVWNCKLDDRWIGMPDAKASKASSDEEREDEEVESAAHVRKSKGEVVSALVKKSRNENASKKNRSSASSDLVSLNGPRKARKVPS